MPYALKYDAAVTSYGHSADKSGKVPELYNSDQGQ